MRGLSVGFLILAFTLASVEAGFGLGRCTYQPVVDSLDFSQYAGDWYEWGRYFIASQVLAECTKNILTENTPFMDVEVEYISFDRIRSKKGQLKYANPDKSDGVLTFDYSVDAFKGKAEMHTFPNYNVLDTDYDSYAIVYNCADLFFAHYDDVYIYTRDRIPDPSLIDDIFSELYKRNIDTSIIARTNQVDCTN